MTRIKLYAEIDLEMDVEIEDADTAAVYVTDSSSNISSRTYKAAVDWSGETTDTGVTNWYSTPSLNTPIEAVLARSGWVANNYLGSAISETSGEVCGFICHFYDSNTSEAPKLYIEYSSGITIALDAA